MLSGERILVTGISGVAGWPIAQFLARDNEVWGVARFRNSPGPGKESWWGPAPAGSVDPELIKAGGITVRSIDLGAGDFRALPQNFSYVLHFAWVRGSLEQLELALRTNVEGAGLLFQHCRRAKAILVVSGMGIYSAHPDPGHLYTETDAIGRGATAYAPTSPAAKLGVEAVARFCGRAFNVPMTIARLNTVMGPPGCLAGQHVRAILGAKAITVPNDPNPHSPIHVDDMKLQVESLLGAAAPSAFITNWCGDEAVTSQRWIGHAANLLGLPASVSVMSQPDVPGGNVADPARRRSVTGPCKADFNESLVRLVEAVRGESALITSGA
jgi:nucleoside-diphosphate-sugar epimerase